MGNIKSIIGKEVYPVDNSYAKCITDPKRPANLAGNYFTVAKKVLVVSEPFDYTYQNILGEITTSKFVTLYHNNDIFIMLNYFREQTDGTLLNHNSK